MPPPSCNVQGGLKDEKIGQEDKEQVQTWCGEWHKKATGTVHPRIGACMFDDVWMQRVGMGELDDPGETRLGQQDWERELGQGRSSR